MGALFALTRASAPACRPTLQLYLHHLQDTCGSGGLPAAVIRVLNSKACRGAIMFGDRLSQAEVSGQPICATLKQTELYLFGSPGS